jgi:hypothetical protein
MMLSLSDECLILHLTRESQLSRERDAGMLYVTSVRPPGRRLQRPEPSLTQKHELLCLY